MTPLQYYDKRIIKLHATLFVTLISFLFDS